MNKELLEFAARLRHSIASGFQNEKFDSLALKLFALQCKNNFACRKICEARGLTPKNVEHWTQIPFVPTSAFKELELTSIEPENRVAAFHSSGTTDQKPSRHFHCRESLELYEISLWECFKKNVLNSKFKVQSSELICLTPLPGRAPNSSLVHMFETIRRKLGGKNVSSSRNFFGKVSADGWILDFDAVLAALNSQSEIRNPQLIFGAAFSFVHLLDFFAERNLKFQLPKNSFVMETGGYKNHSRQLPKAELHSLIEKFLGVPRENIICEYGMSELSSQAYDAKIQNSEFRIQNEKRAFHFPNWARVQIISPETGREVADGETGLIRIFDLANVFSLAAIQTEDLGIRRGEDFELIGRAQFAEPRGCSLMAA